MTAKHSSMQSGEFYLDTSDCLLDRSDRYYDMPTSAVFGLLKGYLGLLSFCCVNGVESYCCGGFQIDRLGFLSHCCFRVFDIYSHRDTNIALLVRPDTIPDDSSAPLKPAISDLGCDTVVLSYI